MLYLKDIFYKHFVVVHNIKEIKLRYIKYDWKETAGDAMQYPPVKHI